MLKPLGYATGQFGKNHLGDRDEFLPTGHGFDEFFGNLYHLNAEEEPENPDYPKRPRVQEEVRATRRAQGHGRRPDQDTGPLTRKRMETIDEEITAGALDFIDRAHKSKKPFSSVELDADAHLDPPQAASRARRASGSTPTAWSSTTATSASC